MKRIQLPTAVVAALAAVVVGFQLVAVPVSAQAPVTDTLGVVRVAKGQPLTIAYWLVVAGPDASLGVDSRRGIEIAIEDRKGRLLDHPVRLIGEDDGCSAEGGVTAATKLAANRAIVAGIVNVSPANTAPRLTAPDRGPDFEGYLRTAHNDKVQGSVAAEFARKVLKVDRAATVHDGSPYAEGLANVFVERFRKGGGTITSQEAIAPTDTDMRPVLTKIAAGNPQLVYYPIFIAAGGHMTRQAKEVPGLANVKLMSADGTFSPDFLRAAGGAAVGMYHSSPDLSPEALGPRYKEFLGKYQKKFGEKPNAAFHAHAYDAANMIFAAIEKVAKKDGGNTFIGRKALRDALFATKNFKGLTGNLTCEKFGDCADPKIAVYQLESADVGKWDPGTNPRRIYP